MLQIHTKHDNLQTSMSLNHQTFRDILSWNMVSQRVGTANQVSEVDYKPLLLNQFGLKMSLLMRTSHDSPLYIGIMPNVVDWLTYRSCGTMTGMSVILIQRNNVVTVVPLRVVNLHDPQRKKNYQQTCLTGTEAAYT